MNALSATTTTTTTTMALHYANQVSTSISGYVLPVRHSYDTRLSRKMDAAVWANWSSCAAETDAAFGRCRLSLWCFHLLCSEYEGLLDHGRAVDGDHERFLRAYGDTICGIAREMHPHGRFLSSIAAWTDLLRATENYATWAFCLTDRAAVPLPRFG
jgi:hypothetical protein